MSYLPHLVVLAPRASHARRSKNSAGRMEFRPSVVPELRDILLSTSEAAF
jgi:hypothetical protein